MEKIQITIYKWLNLMYNINIIKVKENLIKFLIKFSEVNDYEKEFIKQFKKGING